MSLKVGKLDVRCENISQFCPEGAFLTSYPRTASIKFGMASQTY
ncbi:MAG: hypothetical protein C5S48_07985 [Candidatus Methanogaster sp.]|nr:MAG: hypothetical protein C5S48_07985 [ANME-2 cluster archaeon]